MMTNYATLGIINGNTKNGGHLSIQMEPGTVGLSKSHPKGLRELRGRKRIWTTITRARVMEMRETHKGP